MVSVSSPYRRLPGDAISHKRNIRCISPGALRHPHRRSAAGYRTPIAYCHRCCKTSTIAKSRRWRCTRSLPSPRTLTDGSVATHRRLGEGTLASPRSIHSGLAAKLLYQRDSIWLTIWSARRSTTSCWAVAMLWPPSGMKSEPWMK